jgi:hypothetical protein
MWQADVEIVFPRPNNKIHDAKYHENVLASEHNTLVLERPDLKKWLIRRVECMRGVIDVEVAIHPAFSMFNSNLQALR